MDAEDSDFFAKYCYHPATTNEIHNLFSASASYRLSSPNLEEEPEATVLAPSSLAWALEEENKIRYITGGCHPAQVGDNYAGGRYTITGKLGWGEYSTVWLARDKQANMYEHCM